MTVGLPAQGKRLPSAGRHLPLEYLCFPSVGKRWSVDYYRDGIHPSTQGNVVLASIIADAMRK